MNFKTIYDRLKYYEDYRELCVEDILIILNAVYMNLYEDNGTAAVECRVEEPDVMVEELTSQLYGLLELCRTHEADIDAAGAKDLHGIEEELEKIHRKCEGISSRLGNALETRKQLQLEKERLRALEEQQKGEQRQIDALQREIAELQRAIEAHDGTALAQAEARCNALKTENHRLKECYGAIRLKIDDLQADNAELQGAITVAANEQETARKEYDSLVGEVQNLERERDTLKAKIEETEDARNSLNGSLITLNSDITAAEDRLAEIQARMNAKSEEKEQKLGELEQRQKEFEAIDQAYRTAKGKADGLDEAIRTRTRELPVEQKRLADLTAELEPLNAEYSDLQAQISDVNGQTDGMRARLNELRSVLAQKAEIHDAELSAFTQMAQDEADRLANILDDVNEETAGIHSQIADMLTARIPDAKERLAQLRETLKETAREKEKLEAELTEGDKELAALVEELAQKRKDAGTLGGHRERNEQLQQMIDELQPKLEEVERLKAANMALEQRNAAMHKQYDEGSEMIARVHRDAEKLSKLLTKEKKLEIEQAEAQFAVMQTIAANLKTDSALLYQEPFLVSQQLSEDLEQCFRTIKRLEYAIRTYTDMVNGGH